jgi:hypothetical protein
MRSFVVLCLSLSVAACDNYIKIDKATCAQICLNRTVGICPTALVVKTGDLHEDTCAAKGFTTPNGTMSVKAGPCGTISFDLFLTGSGDMNLAFLELGSLTTASLSNDDIDLADFDGSSDFKWTVVDDPVMGGQSKSYLDTTNNVGHWHGKVAIVPFLKSPGFCTIRTGFDQFPNVAGTTEIKMYVRNNATSKLERFMLQLETKGGRSGPKQGTYSGNVTIPATGEWTEVSSRWADFELTWQGEKITGPAMTTQLDQIMQIGLSTFFPGKAGPFDLEIKWMRAGN